jgi:hypothetical protein
VSHDEHEVWTLKVMAALAAVVAMAMTICFGVARVELHEERRESQRLRNELQRERELNIDLKPIRGMDGR